MSFRPVFLVASLVVLTAGCSSSHSTAAALHIVGARSGDLGGVAMPGVHRNQPWVWAPVPVCTTGGPITITAVRAAHTVNGIRVVDWAVKNHTSSGRVNDGRPGTAASLAGFTRARVTTKCTQHLRTFTDFAFSVVITSSRATAGGFSVRWRSRDGVGTSYLPYSVTECTSTKCAAPSSS